MPTVGQITFPILSMFKRSSWLCAYISLEQSKPFWPAALRPSNWALLLASVLASCSWVSKTLKIGKLKWTAFLQKTFYSLAQKHHLSLNLHSATKKIKNCFAAQYKLPYVLAWHSQHDIKYHWVRSIHNVNFYPLLRMKGIFCFWNLRELTSNTISLFQLISPLFTAQMYFC